LLIGQSVGKELNMIIADTLPALREQKNVSQGDIEKAGGPAWLD